MEPLSFPCSSLLLRSFPLYKLNTRIFISETQGSQDRSGRRRILFSDNQNSSSSNQQQRVHKRKWTAITLLAKKCPMSYKIHNQIFSLHYSNGPFCVFPTGPTKCRVKAEEGNIYQHFWLCNLYIFILRIIQA